MNILYAPWRDKYAKDVSKNKTTDVTANECIFCAQNNEYKDEEHFILARFKYHLVMLNLYPYNAGHLLILPIAHIANLHEMSKDARVELIELTNASITILKTVTKAEGFNIGVNLGKAAGAGIPAHFHQHIVPRWLSDTNFLPIIAQTKQISINLIDLYNQLKPHFAEIKI